MNEIHVLLLFVLISILAVLIFSVFSHMSIKRTLRLRYGMERDQLDDEYLKKLSSYFRVHQSEDDVDDITWFDLEMDSIFSLVNHCDSEIGSSVLYWRLRHQKHEDEQVFKDKVNLYQKDENLRDNIRAYFISYLGGVNPGVQPTLDAKQDLQKIDKVLAIILRIGALLGVGFLLVGNYDTAIKLMTMMVILNLMFGEYIRRKMVHNLKTIQMNLGIIRLARKLNRKGLLQKEEAELLKGMLSHLKTIRGSYSFALVDYSQMDIMQMFLGYLASYFLLQVSTYNRVTRKFRKHEEDILRLYRFIGNIDAQLAVASYRTSLSTYCEPEFTAIAAPSFIDIAHPAIERESIRNSLNMRKETLITGSNASGKSTFIKAVAVNALMAQSIYTCCAQSYKLRPAFVISSMAQRDSIQNKESYFVRETKSIKRILDVVAQEDYTMVFIDEILRGTNTIERIAASASILHNLSQKPCSVCCATHDIELTRLLAKHYDNKHFEEEVIEGKINFDFKIKEGPSSSRNALQLLESYEYEQSALILAHKLVEIFEKDHVWDENLLV